MIASPDVNFKYLEIRYNYLIFSCVGMLSVLNTSLFENNSNIFMNVLANILHFEWTIESASFGDSIIFYLKYNIPPSQLPPIPSKQTPLSPLEFKVSLLILYIYIYECICVYTHTHVYD